MEWEITERPGYFGKARDSILAGWNEKYGKYNWKLSWLFGEQILERKEALQIYEDAYYEFLKENKNILNWLISTASEVYDTAPTNIEAKFSYDIQETPGTHLHDVAIRRSVLRLGEKFKGEHLICVRSNDSEGAILSPCKVPFHLPNLIAAGEIKDYNCKGNWWRKLGIENSVEEFYQQNKVLLVRQ